MLEVTGLEAAYGDSQVLFDVTFAIAAGEVVTLLGRNGMGKTTTVSSVMGLLPPRRGAIRFEGQPIERLPSYRIAQRGIGLVPEGRQIFPNLTVRENLVATMMSRMAGGRHWNLDAVLALFPALRERLTSYGGVLSGGEQQMLAIGRALMTNPRLLILDEATEGLAPRIRTEIWRALETLKQEGLSIFIIDKNVQALIRIASRHYVLEKGRIVWSGSSAELAHDVALQHRYLGVQ
jgi:branched-chain amino acid transport system ATP-binding protein